MSMVKRTGAGWLAGLMLLLALVLLAGPAQSQKIAPSLGKHRAAKAVPPDLVVSRIWLDRDCRVNFTVSNAGKGPLSDKARALGLVRIYLDKEPHDFPLKKVDPAGRLAKPGGSISFATNLRPGPDTAVVAVVDPKRKIAESSEANNRTPLKGIPLKCRASLRLDLVKAYVKAGQLHIVIKTPRKSKLRLKDLSGWRLTVQQDGKSRWWPLDRLAAKAKPGIKGDLDLPTGISIKAAGSVLVTLAGGGRVQREKYQLSPRLASTVRTLKKAKPGKPPSEVKKLSPAAKLALTRVKARSRTGRGVAKSASHGLIIGRPYSADVLRRGGEMLLHAYASPGPALADVRFFLIRPGGESHQIHRGAVGTSAAPTSLNVTIPAGVTPADNWVVYGEQVGSGDDPAHATSTRLTIRAGDAAPGESGSAGIVIEAPRAGARVRADQLVVRWRFADSGSPTTGFVPERALIILEPVEAGVVGGQTPITSRDRECTFPVIGIPTQLIGRAARVRVQVGPEVMGDGSIFFAEGVVGPINLMPRASDLVITSPAEGDQLRRGEIIDVRWSHTLSLGRISQWKLELIPASPGPEKPRVAASKTYTPPAAGRAEQATTWQIPESGLRPGGRYRLRVSAAEASEVRAPLSAEVTLRVPEVSYRVLTPFVQPGGKVYRGVPHEVSWREVGELGGELNLFVQYTGRGEVFARQVPVSAGSQPWTPPLFNRTGGTCIPCRIGVVNYWHSNAKGMGFEFQLCDPKIIPRIHFPDFRGQPNTNVHLGSSLRISWQFPDEGMAWRNLPLSQGERFRFAVILMQGTRRVRYLTEVDYRTNEYNWPVGEGDPRLRPGRYAIRVELVGMRSIFGQTDEFIIIAVR